MLAWNLFRKSLLLVVDNFGDAVRVSGLLYGAYCVVAISFYMRDPRLMAADPFSGASETDVLGLASSIFLLVILQVVVFVWIAVAWHRYVLLTEIPEGRVPRFSAGLFWGYLGRSILLGVLIVIAATFAGFIAGFVGTLVAGMSGGVAGGIFGFIIGVILFYRLGIILPAGAIAKPMTISDAWQATRNATGTVFAMAIIAGLFFLLLSLPQNFAGPLLLNIVYTLVVSWITMMVGACLLTTLYGHYVEGRSVD